MSEQTAKVLDQMLRSLERPSPEALYQQLGRLRAEMPHWKDLPKPEASKWLGRAVALVGEAGSAIDVANLRVRIDSTRYHAYGESDANAIALVIDIVLAKSS